LVFEDLEKFETGASLFEDWNSIHNITGDIMKSTRKIEVGPFSSHVRDSFEDFGFGGRVFLILS
jgi:hypothetical protein